LASLAQNLAAVRARIAAAAQAVGRDPGDIRLLTVSKGQPAEAVQAAWAAGQTEFGENYLQEALPKLAALSGRGLAWHFIGPLQANKTRAVATHFDWVHSVDRRQVAERLSAQRSVELPSLDICLQVNVSGEGSKSGVSAAELPALADAVAGLPRLRLRGLMAIPAPAGDLQAQRAPFRRLRELLESLRARGHRLDTLSMGMSDDLEAAVAEGATIVRIGTAVFGPRARKPV
jgi:pyridoxal phosphate enzyme (YggS family)